MIYEVLENILSNFKNKIYAYQGEKVTLISQHGNTVIVEGKKERFPVNKDKVKQI